VSNSTRRKGRRKRKAADRPKKPYDGFPLYAHPLGYWSKKIRGDIKHFGRWGRVVAGKLTRVEGDGWQEALAKYNAQRDDLHAGRTPRTTSKDGLTVKDLCDRFYTAKKRSLDADEITPRTFAEYDATGERIVAAFGRDRLVDDLAADDFEALREGIAKQWGPVRLGNEIQRVRTLFKYGYEAGLIDKPVRFGPAFAKPSRKVLRKHRATGGKRLFTPDEVQRLLEGETVEGDDGEPKTVPPASVPVRAMILLGINAGFGGSDCGALPTSAIDLKGGWVTFPRPKTGIDRRCPLWPETVKALEAAIAERPEPKNEADADLAFITKHGRAWSQSGASHAVTQELGKRLRALKINGRRGLGFYSLRHTFRTVADATRDFPAVRLVMGHADDSIDATYREQIDDDRLRAVADHVRAWLWPKPAKPAKGKAKRKGGAK
jgi:integrase